MRDKVKLVHYDAHIQWEGYAMDAINYGILHLPSGEQVNIRRVSNCSAYDTTGGRLTLGSETFVAKLDEGDKNFDSFESMMLSFGLTRRSKS